MKISFATTQSGRGSTMIGRILPLAAELSEQHDVHVLGLNEILVPTTAKYKVRVVGREPFLRTSKGKRRLGGFRLILNMLLTALRTAWTLYRLRPDVTIIVKTLPSNVLGVYLAKIGLRRMKVVVDTDDFELTANTLTSLSQRAAIHWSERTAIKLSNGIVAASPFLADHMHQLSGLRKEARLIPTGFTGSYNWPVSTISPQRPRLLYIGSISYSSGHRVDLLPAIVDQLVKLRGEVHVRIAGDGDDVMHLKSAFEDLGLGESVEWTGRFKASDLVSLVAGVDVIIDPIDSSVTQRAKSSFRVALALEAAIAVVTSNVGIRPYVLPSELHERFFADPEDVSSYVSVIMDLLVNPLSQSEQRLMQQAAVRNTWKHLAREYEDYIQHI